MVCKRTVTSQYHDPTTPGRLDSTHDDGINSSSFEQLRVRHSRYESVYRNGTHARIHGRNGSYARRTLAKLTRLECGTRAGWQCKFIQNSKEPSARSTSSSSSLVSFSFPRSSLPLPGKTPAVTGMLGSPRKTADYTPENSALRRFVPIDR